MSGPDFPVDGSEHVSVEVYLHRWPASTFKAELLGDGELWFENHKPWDGRDVELAKRVYPGRVVELSDGGHVMAVKPGESKLGLFEEFLAEREAEWEAMSEEERAQYEEESVRAMHAIARPRSRRVRRSELELQDTVEEIVDEEWLVVGRVPTLDEFRAEEASRELVIISPEEYLERRTRPRPELPYVEPPVLRWDVVVRTENEGGRPETRLVEHKSVFEAPSVSGAFARAMSWAGQWDEVEQVVLRRMLPGEA